MIKKCFINVVVFNTRKRPESDPYLFFDYLQNLMYIGAYVHAYLHTYVGVSNLRSVRTTNTTITVEWDPADSPSGCGPLLYYVCCDYSEFN